MQIKSKRYATMFSVAIEALDDKQYMKWCIKHQSKLKSLPKNTLKVKFIRRIIDYNMDDFIYNRKSVHTLYEVFTFNRNK